MANENKTGLVGIQGNKVVDIEKKAKEPQEKMYDFTHISGEGGVDTFSAFGVLVVTPGFVGVGDKEQTEIRAVVPLSVLVRVRESQSVASTSQGSA